MYPCGTAHSQKTPFVHRPLETKTNLSTIIVNCAFKDSLKHVHGAGCQQLQSCSCKVIVQFLHVLGRV